MRFSIILPTHNPDTERLRRTLLGLRAQTISSENIEVLIVDNASTRFPSAESLAASAPAKFSVIHEPQLGLTHARQAGLRAAKGEFAVFVDDDNVLAPNYLEEATKGFLRLPRVGALGGKSLPEFSTPVAADDWRREFFPLLALRDLGDAELVSQGLLPLNSPINSYPTFAPIGAGMALRIEAVQTWLTTKSNVSDRRGDALTSAGDNDIVLSIMKAGWEVGYFPTLTLTHLIPSHRVTTGYLCRLNRGIQKSWIEVLTAHNASPWPTVPAWTVPLRQLKAWFTYHAWKDPAAHVRWQGACGHFEGRVLHRSS